MSPRLLVLPGLAAIAVRALGATLSLTAQGVEALEPLWAARRPLIYMVWHGRILMVPWLNRRLCRTHGARPARVLASRSRDGELVARFVGRFGLDVVRGSSSRGGAEALRLLARSIRDGHDVVVVPDGPRGPREMVKAGVVTLARISGAPIVPMALGASAEWRLSSWDEFRIPKPFSRCVLRFGDPIRVPDTADRAAAEASRKDVEAALRALSWRVDTEARA